MYYPQAPNDWLYNIHEKYDLPKITLHGFRHTQASLLFESGASIKEVQGRFGHKDVKTTMNIYTHVTPEKVRETGEQFAKYVNFYQMAFTLKPRNKKRAQNIVNSMFWYSLNLLPHRPFHFISNQSVQLDCIFHRQFFGEWFDESHDDHFSGFLFAESATHEVVQLFFRYA